MTVERRPKMHLGAYNEWASNGFAAGVILGRISVPIGSYKLKIENLKMKNCGTASKLLNCPTVILLNYYNVN